MVTTCEAEEGPLQPVAVAVIIDVPFQLPVQVTAPVATIIVLPPAILAGSSA